MINFLILVQEIQKVDQSQAKKLKVKINIFRKDLIIEKEKRRPTRMG